MADGVRELAAVSEVSAMGGKQIVYNESARHALMRGVNKLADAVMTGPPESATWIMRVPSISQTVRACPA
jgi:hypothetical protein